MEAFVAIVSIVATICSLYILHRKMTEEPYIVDVGLYYYSYVIHNDTVIKLAVKSSVINMLESGHAESNIELFQILIKEDIKDYIINVNYDY